MAYEEIMTKPTLSSAISKTTSTISVTETNATMAMVAKIKGKTYKKNLLPLKKFAASTEVNKVTLVPTYDGDKLLYITISGTATGGNADFDLTDGFTVQFVNGKGYILTGCPAGGSESKYRLLVQDSAYAVNPIDYGSGSTFIANANKFRATIRIIEGQTVNLKFYPMIRENTVTNGEYVPYGTLQNAPVESVVSQGVNIWNEKWELGGLNWDTGNTTVNSDRIRSVDYIEVVGGLDYNVNSNTHGSKVMCVLYDANKTAIGNYSSLGLDNGIQGTTFKLPGNAKYMKLVIIKTSYMNDVTLRVGSTVTDKYTPYSFKTTVLVPQSIRNLPDFGVENNIVDFENGTYTHNNTISNGAVTTYTGSDKVIPLTDYLRPLPVENGGTLTLVNPHNLDINSTIKYKKEV